MAQNWFFLECIVLRNFATVVNKWNLPRDISPEIIFLLINLDLYCSVGVEWKSLWKFPLWRVWYNMNLTCWYSENLYSRDTKHTRYMASFFFDSIWLIFVSRNIGASSCTGIKGWVWFGCTLVQGFVVIGNIQYSVWKYWVYQKSTSICFG